MPANNNVWTPNMEERLLHMLDNGVSYLEIAKAISREFNIRITTNACIGKGRRMQVPLRSPPRKRALCRRRENPRSSPEQRSRQQSERRNSPKRKARRRAQASQQNPRRRAQPSKRKDLTLLQLRPTSCRWPNGSSPNITFCGDHQVEGSSYCLKHTLIASPGYGRAR